MKKTTKTPAIPDVADCRFEKRKEVTTKYFAKWHITLPYRRKYFYYDLPGCKTIDEADQLARCLWHQENRWLAYDGGRIDTPIEVIENK